MPGWDSGRAAFQFILIIIACGLPSVDPFNNHYIPQFLPFNWSKPCIVLESTCCSFIKYWNFPYPSFTIERRMLKIANIFDKVTKYYLVWHSPWHQSEIHNGHCLPTQTQGGNTFLIFLQRGYSVSQMFKQSL